VNQLMVAQPVAGIGSGRDRQGRGGICQSKGAIRTVPLPEWRWERPGYMSPEQVRGEKLDACTDLFSFGLVLYEMATGQRAFRGETAPILRDAILNRTSIAVQELNSALPPKLEVIISKAIEKDCRRRATSQRRKCARRTEHSQDGASGARLEAAAIAAAVILTALVGGGFY